MVTQTLLLVTMMMVLMVVMVVMMMVVMKVNVIWTCNALFLFDSQQEADLCVINRPERQCMG